MTEVNPPGFLQNSSAHTAEVTRGAITTLLTGKTGTNFTAAGGVHPDIAGQFAVTQNGTPNMTVNVASGVVFIPGTEGSKQGTYVAINDATVNKSITASDATLNRIDLVVAKVQDQVYSGATNSWSIAVVTGTAAGSPAAPTAPANSVIIAQIAVGAGVTTITNANITDKRRPYAAALRGTIQTNSSNRPAWVSSTVGLGQPIYEEDTTNFGFWNGTAWKFPFVPVGLPWRQFARKTADQTVNNSATLVNDTHLFVPMVANATYTGMLLLFYSSNTTASIKFAFTFPAGATVSWAPVAYQAVGSFTILLSALNTYQSGVDNPLFGAGGSDFPTAIINIIARTAGTAGNLQLRWAQNTANVSNTTIKQDSYMIVTREA
jgi:hypothetical protein